MKWLVLKARGWPHGCRLHSEPWWNAMAEDYRRQYEVVQLCEDRTEANTVLDALVAANPRPDPKKRMTRRRGR